jgi:DNA-binding beta-propeller fold protein YncE
MANQQGLPGYLKRILILVASVAIISGAVVLAPSAARDGAGESFKPVAGWPKLPAGFAFGQTTAVATDSADRVYVFHRGKQPIMVFDKDGKFLRSWGDDFVKNAHGLRIDRDGNVWITDLAYHLVMKFTPAGKLLLTLGKKGQAGETEDTFNKPADVAFGPKAEIYVADGYGNSRVVKFTRDGKFLKTWGKKGKGKGQFNLPHAICIDGGGKVYVGDRENDRIQVFDLEGNYLTQWNETGAPFGLFLTHDRRMFLADGRADLARILNLDGKSLTRWGQKGSAPGQFDLPHAICMDSRGAVYVTEITGKRVQKFRAR